MDDLFYITSTLLVMALTIVMGMYMLNNFTPKLLALSPENSTDYNSTSTLMTNVKATFTQTYDSSFAVVFVLMVASSMILSSLIPTNPIFALPFIFIMSILVVITAITSNLWSAFATDPLMASTVAEFVFIPFVMDNLPLLTVLLGFTLGSIIYVSWKRG